MCLSFLWRISLNLYLRVLFFLLYETGNVARAMFTMLRMQTLDSWDQILNIAIFGCDVFPAGERIIEIGIKREGIGFLSHLNVLLAFLMCFSPVRAHARTHSPFLSLPAYWTDRSVFLHPTSSFYSKRLSFHPAPRRRSRRDRVHRAESLGLALGAAFPRSDHIRGLRAPHGAGGHRLDFVRGGQQNRRSGRRNGKRRRQRSGQDAARLAGVFQRRAHGPGALFSLFFQRLLVG